MTWKDQLVKASFRGAPFFYFDTEGAGGRRLAVHEFPLRDTPFIEDMGRRLRLYRIEAYVIGDDYFSARDALITALEGAGPGTLQHPYLGPLSVFVKGFRWAERRDDGRMASFEIEFVESGVQPSPTSVTDTSGASSDSADEMQAQAQTSFTGAYGTA